MFCSSSSFNPVQYPNQTMLANPFIDTQNPSSIQEHHSPPCLYFPENFLDDGDLLVNEFLLLQQQQQNLGSNITLAAESQDINPEASNKATKINNKKNRSNVKAAKQPIPRRRTGKKDRHSKIYTAQGPRDRRMRLSLQIARKFFDLQDMLGFDKASKTIEWLFIKSKTAIREVTDSLPRLKKSSSAGGKSVRPTSESEVVSGIKLMPNNQDNTGMVAEGDSFVSTSRGKKSKKSRKTVFNPFARESRDKARARARERTREKMKINGLDNSKLSSQANPNNLEELGSCSRLENGENLGSRSLEQNSHVKLVGEEEETSTHLLQQQMDSVSIIDKFLGITSAPRSSSIFDFSHNSVVPSGSNFEDKLPGFPVNWDINNARLQHRYSGMPNMKLLTGDVHLQNPNAIFMTTPNAQEQKTSSNLASTSNAQEQNLNGIFLPTLNPQQENPSSAFMNISNPNEQNPISILMTTTDTGLHSHLTENQFSCNSIVRHNYGSLY